MEIFLKKLLHFRFGYAIINKLFGARQYAPLAQLDRAFGYEPKGQGFESLAARQKRSDTLVLLLFLFFYNFLRDSNPERVSDVKKTVLWTVFSCEV